MSNFLCSWDGVITEVANSSSEAGCSMRMYIK